MTSVLGIGRRVAPSPRPTAATAAAQRAQGPVPTGPEALPRVSRTMSLGIAKPPSGPPPVDLANTVAETRPAASTIGPPELPGCTSPRKDVILRRTRRRP